jgi:hypothetical protein
MDKKILCFCPISSRAWVLPHFLEHILNIDYPNHLIHFYFIINNSNDNSLALLKNFKAEYIAKFGDIKIEIYNSSDKFKDDRSGEVRHKYTYNWLSELRNKGLKECVKSGCDYLFSCDCDILVPSNILKEFVSANVDVIASLIYNGYLFMPNGVGKDYKPIENAYKYPNILNISKDGGYIHITNYYTKNPHKCDKEKMLEIDATGAVSLISQRVCAISKYTYDSQGEDMSWSKTVRDAGYKLYCKPSVYSQHIMNEELLQMYLNDELKFADGSSCKNYLKSIDK